MATAISKLVERDYVLKQDQGTDNPTVFRLRALTGLQRIDVRDAFGRGEETVARRIITHGLAGWSNLRDADGQAVPWAPGNIARNLDCLPEDAIAELAKEIFESTFLTEDERKN